MAGEGEGGSGLGGLTENQLATLDASLERAAKLEQKMKEIAEASLDYNRALQAGYEIQELSLRAVEKLLASNESNQKVLEQIQALEFASAETIEKITNLQNEAAKSGASEEETRAKILDLLQEEKATFDLIRQTSRETEQFVGGIAGKLGIATKFGDTAIGKFAAMGEKLEKTGKAGEIVAAALETTLNPANLAVALLEKMYESVFAVALALDSANAQFQRATGFAGDFKGQMMGIATAGVASGVGIEDAGKAMASLTNNFSAFNPNAEATNKTLGTTIALLEKTGVSGDQSAKTMDFFNKVLGATPVAAANMTKQLALAGTNIGISTSKMLSDFESVSGYIVGFGDRTTEVFLELQAQAKATGVAIGTLVAIGKKFDTFDEAAKTVGSLNAALGTQLSTIEMINMSTEQRIANLAQEIDLAAGGFNNLDRYTQMYVAQAIGAKDVAEAERLISMQRNPAELAKYNAKMQEQQARQQNLNELTEQFVPVLEQFKIAVLGLGLALEPVIKILSFAFEIFGNIVGVITKLLIDVPILTDVLASLAVGIALYYSFSGIASMFMAMAAGIKAMDLASTLATKRGIIGLVSMLVTLATLLAMRINPVFVAAFHFMAVGVRAMAMAMNAAQPQALIFALAVGIIAASVALLVYAMSELITSITGLFSLFVQNVAILPQLATGLYAVGGAFAVFGAGLMAGAYGLAVAVPLLLVMALLMDPIIEKVTALGQAFNLVGAGMTAITEGLDAISRFKDNDDFFAITTDGGKTSMVSAKGGIIKNFTSDSITVDVKIPEIKMPEVNVKVYIGDRELRDIIRKEVNKI